MALGKAEDKIFIIKLIYSLPTSGQGRTLSMIEKLSRLNLNLDSKKDNRLNFDFKDNPENTNVLFFIGFFLGDGHLGLLPYWNDSTLRWIIRPRLTIVQLAKESHEFIMNNLKFLLESLLNIKVYLFKIGKSQIGANTQNKYQDPGISRLVVTGLPKPRHGL